MKISVFFDRYCPFHESKDPGQIPLGLMDNGLNSSVITTVKKELDGYRPKFVLTQRYMNEFLTEKFWLEDDSDVIVAYPVEGDSQSALIEKMKLGGKKVILKLDSDGKIAYPLQRDYFMVPLKERLSARNVIGDLWWRLASKSQKYRRHAEVAAEAIKCIELSNRVVIECPDALANLNYFLTAWGRSDLIKKTHWLPDPVQPEFINGNIGAKEKVVVSFGRWHDTQQKNTALLVKTAVAFLKSRPDYRFTVFGGGTDSVKTLLADAPQSIRERFEVLGFVDQAKIVELLGLAQMIFVPSRWESFSIASGEALCMGCSVVGTPIESLRFLSMQGFSGSTAATFDGDAVLAALLQDAHKWDQNEYAPVQIAQFWRPKLDRRSVAKSIEHLVAAN